MFIIFTVSFLTLATLCLCIVGPDFGNHLMSLLANTAKKPLEEHMEKNERKQLLLSPYISWSTAISHKSNVEDKVKR